MTRGLHLVPRLMAALLALPACKGGRITTLATPSVDGEPARGAEIIASAGCGACHSIPGVRGARGEVGPPLDRFARRSTIAGELSNTPDNLRRWISDPPSVHPHTAMPALGLDPQQIRDVTAYLYTLD